jgi:pimeloyl-ACP methyl ester carboxylesterase
MQLRERGLIGVASGALVLLTACGGGPARSADDEPTRSASRSSAATSPSASATETALRRIALPVRRGATVEGLIDVHGHDIYARCAGKGAPTIVYFTGWAPDPGKRGVEAVAGIESADAGRHRVCSYERRNTGRSESVSGTQTPADVVGDVDGVLDALGEKGPFLLLGASFGGLIAGAYAVAHPDRVSGIVLLDASITDDYIIDKLHGFTGMCLPENRDADAHDSLEKLDNCRLAKWAYDRRDREPGVPLVYLASTDSSEREPISDDKYRKRFVARWSPGVWKVVGAPHYMDESDPQLVEQYLQKVIGLAQR